MRRVIVLYNAYKLRLDKIFRLGYSTFLFFQNKTINLSSNFDASFRPIIHSYDVFVKIRSKRLNNYMVLSPHAAQQKTREEISQYYKLRLYKYIHR